MLEMSSSERDNDIVSEEIPDEIGEESEKMIEDKRVSDKERYGKMSQSSWYRYLEQANKYLETFSEIKKVNMFVKIVSHGKFELEKIGVSVDEMSVKEFLQLRLSKWSEFQLRSIVESLESIHLKAGEPSLLLKELLSPLLSSTFTLHC